MSYKKSLQVMIFDNVADLANYKGDKRQMAFCDDAEVPFTFNTTTGLWDVSNRTVVLKSTVIVNGAVTGNVKVYTTPPSALTFFPTMILFKVEDISGVTIKPTVSIGTNSPNYDNISAASLLNTVLGTVGATGGSPQLTTTTYPVPGNTDIYARVSINAVATSYKFKVYIIGFYDN